MTYTKDSPTLEKYKNTMTDCILMYYPEIPISDIHAAIDYSIEKRMYNANAVITNSYKRRRITVEDDRGNQRKKYIDAQQNTTLQKISDYILSKEPIVTAFGTMFMHHTTVPNPLQEVVQLFLDNRTIHKKQMFQFPKGSEDFEKYNLLQSLTYLGTPNGDIGAQTL